MIENFYNQPTRVCSLQDTIFEEIIGSQGGQLVIDELGVAMATHLGHKRNRNEDRIVVARVVAPNREIYSAALVCDGVGGSECGDKAAAIAIAGIISNLAQEKGRPSLKELAVKLVKQADDLVRTELQGRGTTTLVMLLTTTKGHLVCANVGDSRAYKWDLSTNKLDQVTVDDTIENELKQLPGNAVSLIKARGLEGRLSQAIGESGRRIEDLRIQIYTEEKFNSGAALGSDGLWRAAKDFEAAVANSTSPTDAVRRAITLANWVGGVDNASLIVIGDMQRFSGYQQNQTATDIEKTGITLWLPSTKIKILTSYLINKIRPLQARVKTEKRKIKTKAQAKLETPSNSQLSFETVDSNEAKPKIEVMISDAPKVS